MFQHLKGFVGIGLLLLAAMGFAYGSPSQVPTGSLTAPSSTDPEVPAGSCTDETGEVEVDDEAPADPGDDEPADDQESGDDGTDDQAVGDEDDPDGNADDSEDCDSDDEGGGTEGDEAEACDTGSGDDSEPDTCEMDDDEGDAKDSDGADRDNHGAAVRVAAHCDVKGRAHGELVRSVATNKDATVAGAEAACIAAMEEVQEGEGTSIKKPKKTKPTREHATGTKKDKALKGHGKPEHSGKDKGSTETDTGPAPSNDSGSPAGGPPSPGKGNGNGKGHGKP